ncbi:MAG: SET domain-containing protein [Proteobacteria bacterium]|nr:SET domain-containing protein [Pseudomonadota bacterium]
MFAAEPIPAGTVWWKFVEGFDSVLTPEEVDALPPLAQQHIRTYASLWKGMWIHCADHAIFTNHSDHPNSYGVYPEGALFGWSIARRDIAAGEEITEDYRTFCDDWKDYPYLKHHINGLGSSSEIHASSSL